MSDLEALCQYVAGIANETSATIDNLYQLKANLGKEVAAFDHITSGTRDQSAEKVKRAFQVAQLNVEKSILYLTATVDSCESFCGSHSEKVLVLKRTRR